jgi:hypothetical protein
MNGGGWHMDPLVRALLWLLLVLAFMFIVAIGLSLVQRVTGQ